MSLTAFICGAKQGFRKKKELPFKCSELSVPGRRAHLRKTLSGRFTFDCWLVSSNPALTEPQWQFSAPYPDRSMKDGLAVEAKNWKSAFSPVSGAAEGRKQRQYLIGSKNSWIIHCFGNSPATPDNFPLTLCEIHRQREIKFKTFFSPCLCNVWTQSCEDTHPAKSQRLSCYCVMTALLLQKRNIGRVAVCIWWLFATSRQLQRTLIACQ